MEYLQAPSSFITATTGIVTESQRYVEMRKDRIDESQKLKMEITDAFN